METIGIIGCFIGIIYGIYWGLGFRRVRNKVETTIVYWGYIGFSSIGIMENRMETII